MKKIFLLLVCILLSGCTTTEKKDTKGNAYCGDDKQDSCQIETSADMSAYENFTEKDNQFTEIKINEVFSMLKTQESGIVYFGFPLCPWCVEALPIMNEAAKLKDATIFYVQTRDENKQQLYTDEQKAKIMSYTDEYLESDEDGNKQFYVPFVIVIHKGEIVAGHIGTVDGYDTHERKMNNKEKEELKAIYTDMFSKL